ncbi:MAG TPA: VWA domain-containing protein [Vicinamibacteria bacterium]|nr:VWA domain-containing protein [Vicinamibacteria bacterium]
MTATQVTFRRAVVPPLALLLGVSSATQAVPRPAQQPGATPSLPPVRAELVQLDVVVTDRDGRCVAGLGSGDFEVFEDGRLQPLSHFAEEARPGLRAAPAAMPPPGPAPAAAPAPPAPRGRFFVLAVDDLHTAPGNMAEARRAMTRFVEEQVSAEDLVALATTSGTRGAFQDFTRDKVALRRAIARVESRYQPVEPGGTPYLSEYQAELIDRTDVEALNLAVREVLQTEDYLGEVGARERVYAQARRMVFEIMQRSGRALEAVLGLVQGLAPLPGRKVVVLVSDGFLVGLGAAENRGLDVRRVVDAATRSGVVLYALDTRGLVADVPGGGASFQGPQVLAAPGARQSLQARGNEAQRQSLNALAEDTGGFLVRNSNDLGQGLGRILRDNEAYYLLAYAPTNAARDGKFRRIEVRLRGRTGLLVRTRSGYFAPDDRMAAATSETKEALREREIGQALGSLFPLEGVPMRMSADFIDLPPAGPQAVIRTHLDVSGVPFVPTGDRYAADLEIAGAVYDESGRLVGEVTGERAQLSLTEESYRKAVQDGLTVQKTLALPPGRFQVRMAAREATRSLLGSASRWVEIPDVAASPLTLSSVFLLADAGKGATDLADVQVEKRFRGGQGLHYVVHAYSPSRGGPGAPAATLQAQVWRGTKLVGVTPKHDLVRAPGEGAAKWSERISLEGFTPGSYELRVVASAGSATAERRVAFAVE